MLLYPKATTRNDLKTIEGSGAHLKQMFSLFLCCFLVVSLKQGFVVRQDDCRILWVKTSLVFSFGSCLHVIALLFPEIVFFQGPKFL